MYRAVDSTEATIEYVRIAPVEDPPPFRVSNVSGDEYYCTQPYWNDAAAYFEDKEHIIVLLSSTSACLVSLYPYWLPRIGFNKAWLIHLQRRRYGASPPGY
ncbi:hypothetical protein DL768_003732 [Monosporascus sp. mg162]|nr:hypothetical protein DL768_003732 [Monosporascus sp. mg162]